jgi:hypothetical protein
VCNCLDKVIKGVKEQTGDEDATVDWTVVFSNPVRYLPRIEYTYRKKNKNGLFQKRIEKGTMIPTYCPWCGKKYEEKEA